MHAASVSQAGLVIWGNAYWDEECAAATLDMQRAAWAAHLMRIWRSWHAGLASLNCRMCVGKLASAEKSGCHQFWLAFLAMMFHVRGRKVHRVLHPCQPSHCVELGRRCKLEVSGLAPEWM